MTYDRIALAAELTRDEDRRLKPYVDSVGKISIGVGRNLTDVGISARECAQMLDNDIARSEFDLDRTLPWWRTLDDVRQRVLLNICFNLGVGRLLDFRKALAAMQIRAWDIAATQMLWNSPGAPTTWAKQVGARAQRLAQAMRSGVMPE